MDTIFHIIILVFSVVIHEVAHGYAAYMLGDHTAKYQGRLTLNPLKHLDPFGSVILPLLLHLSNAGFMIGWAKPVPFNPYNLKNQRWGEAIVAVAGPLSNIAIALIFGIFIRIGLTAGFMSAEVLNITAYIVLINLVLAVFNLVPIPPLDGSKIIFTIFNVQWNQTRLFLERFGFFLVLGFVFLLWPVVSPVILHLFALITGVSI
ncbi:MAG TPA: site-2 protease family protein [Candidatus Nanoarchaeia archaeon]|nr:site-2 protease family protein [Candidatus Nanoarchaeia archaeon]